MASAIQRENVVRKKDGSLCIPETQRQDGSWRKERKVKEGYIPPDEVPAYKTRGQIEKETIASLPPPGMTSTIEYIAPKPTTKSKSQKKAEKRKEKKRLAKEKESSLDSQVDLLTETTLKLQVASKKKNEEQPESDPSTEQQVELDSEKDKLKKTRTLRKKLKQIRELESKIASGALPNPEPEQLVKISKKDELISELALLGVDYDDWLTI